MRTIVKRLARDSLHGGLLKLLSVAARGLFFFLVIPRLPAGVLSEYMFISSMAVIGATALMLGLDEELPRVIRGSVATARAYLRWYSVLNVMGIIGLVTLATNASVYLAIVALLLALAAGKILGGIIRSIDPRINEQIQNLPWVSFIAIVIIFRIDETVTLIAVMAASFLAVQYLGAYLVLKRDNHSAAVEPVALRALIRHGLEHGSSRLVSNVFLSTVIRSAIIWPVWFGYSGNLDQIAFAIAIGEIVAQFGRIPANQAYSRWCRNPPMLRSDWRGAILSSLILSVGLFVASSIGILLLDILGWLPRQASNIELQMQALLLSSTIPAFRLMRYLLWSRGILANWIALLTVAMAILAALAIYSLDDTQWFYGLASLTAVGIALMAIKSSRYFELPKQE